MKAGPNGDGRMTGKLSSTLAQEIVKLRRGLRASLRDPFLPPNLTGKFTMAKIGNAQKYELVKPLIS